MIESVNNILISVVIPMYNESSIIEETARTLHTYMTETFGKGCFEILFSNDGSLDGCEKLVEKMIPFYRSATADGKKKIENEYFYSHGRADRKRDSQRKI